MSERIRSLKRAPPTKGDITLKVALLRHNVAALRQLRDFRDGKVKKVWIVNDTGHDMLLPSHDDPKLDQHIAEAEAALAKMEAAG